MEAEKPIGRPQREWLRPQGPGSAAKQVLAAPRKARLTQAGASQPRPPAVPAVGRACKNHAPNATPTRRPIKGAGLSPLGFECSFGVDGGQGRRVQLGATPRPVLREPQPCCSGTRSPNTTTSTTLAATCGKARQHLPTIGVRALTDPCGAASREGPSGRPPPRVGSGKRRCADTRGVPLPGLPAARCVPGRVSRVAFPLSLLHSSRRNKLASSIRSWSVREARPRSLLFSALRAPQVDSGSRSALQPWGLGLLGGGRLCPG